MPPPTQILAGQQYAASSWNVVSKPRTVDRPGAVRPVGSSASYWRSSFPRAHRQCRNQPGKHPEAGTSGNRCTLYCGALDQINVYKPWGPPAWFLVSLVACVRLRADASRPATPPAEMTWWNQVNKSAVIVSAIAFLIWAHAVSSVPIFGWNNQTLAGLVAIVFGAVAPRFVSASAIA
jgi:hypothetical protein